MNRNCGKINHFNMLYVIYCDLDKMIKIDFDGSYYCNVKSRIELYIMMMNCNRNETNIKIKNLVKLYYIKMDKAVKHTANENAKEMKH